MNILVLKKDVNVRGFDFWGREAQTIFHPGEEKTSEWFWRTSRYDDIFISPDRIASNARRLRLCFANEKIEIWEHFGVLRWFGLLGLEIESTSWPPYFGRSLEFWEALKPYCEIQDVDIKWHTPLKTVRCVYPKLRGGKEAFTEISPSNEKKLEITVICSYEGIGEKTVNYSFPNNTILARLCSFYTIGLPKSLYCFSKVADRLHLWPHHRHVIWQKEAGGEEALRQATCHRVIDLLGTLSLICEGGFLSAKVLSVCSGHEGDIGAIKKAQRFLIKI